MEHPPSPSFKPVQFGLLVALGLTALYAVIYQKQPLPGTWNDIYLNLMIAIPALLAAAAALLVWRSFAPGDRPKSVWLAFSLGLILWAVAEVIWFWLWFVNGDVPAIALPDVFWLAGLVPFCLAFVLQYRVIYYFTRREAIIWSVLILVATLVVAAVATLMLVSWGSLAEGESLLVTYLNVYYAVSDAAMLIAALGLGHLFGRGLWGRAWLALLVFVISDGLYSYVEMSGMYAQSVETGNILTLVVDATYSLAYMLMALGVYSQYLLVRHGPTLLPPIED